MCRSFLEDSRVSSAKDKESPSGSAARDGNRASSSSSAGSWSSTNTVLDDLLTQLDGVFAKKFAGLSGVALEDAIMAAFVDYDTYHHARDKSGSLDRSVRMFANVFKAMVLI